MESFTTAACTLHSDLQHFQRFRKEKDCLRKRKIVLIFIDIYYKYNNIHWHSEWMSISNQDIEVIHILDELSSDKIMILARVYCFWFDKSSSVPLLVSNGLFCIQPSTSHYLISKSEIEKTYLWQKCRRESIQFSPDQGRYINWLTKNPLILQKCGLFTPSLSFLAQYPPPAKMTLS